MKNNRKQKGEITIKIVFLFQTDNSYCYCQRHYDTCETILFYCKGLERCKGDLSWIIIFLLKIENCMMKYCIREAFKNKK